VKALKEQVSQLAPNRWFGGAIEGNDADSEDRAAGVAREMSHDQHPV
jgi:hypothetical protein